MASLFSSLSIGHSGLSTHQSAIAVVGNNMANAATPGYSRQTVVIGTKPMIQVAGGQYSGSGAQVDEIHRSFDRFTYERILQEKTRSGYYQAQQPDLNVLNAAYNESATGGLSQAVNDFFSSINGLVSNPEGSTERDSTLSAADSLINRFHSLASSLSASREALNERVLVSVDIINEAASQIAELNGQIASLEGGGAVASTLRDERDQLIKALSNEANINIHEEDTGSVTVFLANQVLVRGERSSSLVAEEDPLNRNYVNVVLQGNDVDRDITDKITGGALGGALSLRDTTLPGYQEELDTLAYTLAVEFNAQHQAGYGLDGVNGRDFFAPPGSVSGAAARLQLSSDVAGNPDAIAASLTPGGISGDNGNAILLYQLSEKKLVEGNATFAESAIAQASQVGNDARFVNGEVSYQRQILGELEQIEQSVSGVSIDQEATDLVKYQSAYQASARFVSTVREMLNTLMQL